MAYGLIFAMAVGPGVLWLWCFYRRDRFEPEPLRLVAWVYLLGAASTWAAFWFEEPFTPYFAFLSVVWAPIVEELVKFAVVLVFVYRHAEFDEPMDGLVYGAAAALGFASAENVLYVLSAYWRADSLALDSPVYSLVLVRGLMSVPGHALNSACWGYALGLAKFAAPGRALPIVAMGLLASMVLHGAWNAIQEFKGPFIEDYAEAIGLLMIALLVGCRYLYSHFAAKADSQSPFRPRRGE